MPDTKPPWDERTTLLRPPPPNPDRAPIENALEVTELAVLGPDIFTNTRELWLPPGARGIYGGFVIAQCLASAQKTVPAEFMVHSCHCYFLLAGSASTPILFHVERVRDGRSFATRTVQARQRGKCIFTTTVSFVREGSGGGADEVHHAAGLPRRAGLPPPPPPSPPPPPPVVEGWNANDEPDEWERQSPVQAINAAMKKSTDDDRRRLDERRLLRWSRTRGTISAAGGHQAHINALAYMSDSYFIGTVSRLHGLSSRLHGLSSRLPVAPRADGAEVPEDELHVVMESVAVDDGDGDGDVDGDGDGDRNKCETAPRLGMLVSLDHSIYFHAPARVRADKWMLSEMQSPWSGDGRGFVLQRIFAADGTLLASCMQEGVVRLDRSGREKGSKV